MENEKALARRALEMWAVRSSIDISIFSPAYLNHQEPVAKGYVGTVDLETWTKIVVSNHEAFPDLKVEILAQIAEGDRVSTHWRFKGTQLGSYLGHPPSGRSVDWTGIQIDRFENGLIAESWVVWDFHTQLVELGLSKEF
ncbi:ester cyclase [Ruegeria lacuscaerulensis]|uniref:ester cyclase n=1 Tax=Ruegeria lacuscaerulensis TaxID=55218 RepID=UPI00147F4F31|nr:ester cyclase [Ruegeria lacuscaerulensis]